MMNFFEKYQQKIDQLHARISSLSKTRETLSARASLIQISAIKNEINKLKKELSDEVKKSKKKINRIFIILRCQNRNKEIDLSILISHYDDFDIKNNYESYLKNPEKQCKKLKKDISNFKKESINKLESSINRLMSEELLVKQKSLLERLYFTGAIILGSLPILSFLGFSILLSYLYQIDSTLYFMEIAVDGGIWFSIAFGVIIFLTQLLMPCIIVFSQSKNIKKLDIILILFFYAFSFISSTIGLYIFYNDDIALILASLWHIFVLLISRSYKKSLSKKEVGTTPIFFSIVIGCFSILILAVPFITKVFDHPVHFRLNNVFKTIGFSQSGYSWFKVNNTYFDRTGLSINHLKDKEKYFSDIHDINFMRTENNVFLYGKLWVNSTKIKILCPLVNLMKNNNL